MRRQSRNGRSSSGGTENKKTELGCSEKRKAIGGVVGNKIGRGGGGKGGFFRSRELLEIGFGDDRGFVGWFGRGAKL